jgi:hypothetical protein
MLLAGGAGLLILGALAYRFHRGDGTGAAPSRSAVASVRTVIELPYASLLALLVLGFSLIQQLTDFVFRQRAVQLLGEADMADVFASHQLWTGVFCVVFQFVAAEPLLRRLGILRYVAVVPGVIAALTVLSGVWPSVWGAWALKLFESAASWSLLPVAVQLLYAPLPDDVRDGVRRTIDGLLRKVGMGVAGVVLLAVSAAVGPWGVLVAVLSVCAGLGVVLWKIRPRYLEALHLRVAGQTQANLVGAELSLLGEMLRSPSPERALRAAELLEYAEAIDESHARVMLGHPHERVQARGVEVAEALRASALAKPLEALVQSGARRPRDAAVWALARLAPERARVVLPPLVVRDDIALVTAAVGGLLSLQGEKHPGALGVFEIPPTPDCWRATSTMVRARSGRWRSPRRGKGSSSSWRRGCCGSSRGGTSDARRERPSRRWAMTWCRCSRRRSTIEPARCRCARSCRACSDASARRRRSMRSCSPTPGTTPRCTTAWVTRWRASTTSTPSSSSIARA